MKPAAALLWSIAICLTLDSAAFAADPRAMQLRYQPWTKYCIGSNCFVGIEARGRCMPSGGWVLFILEDGKAVNVSSSFFSKSVRGPISLRIDADSPIPLPDPTCLPSGLCVSKLAIDDGLIARLKRAQTIAIEATGMTGERFALSFSLGDFAHVYDGPGAEPKVFEETQQSLRAKLRDREAENGPPPACEE